jgi:hypothetical protein
VHVFDHGRASLRFLLHRKCNLGFSPLNTRRGTFFWLALSRFKLFCFVHDRQAVYAIPCLIEIGIQNRDCEFVFPPILPFPANSIRVGLIAALAFSRFSVETKEAANRDGL